MVEHVNLLNPEGETVVRGHLAGKLVKVLGFLRVAVLLVQITQPIVDHGVDFGFVRVGIHQFAQNGDAIFPHSSVGKTYCHLQV